MEGLICRLTLLLLFAAAALLPAQEYRVVLKRPSSHGKERMSVVANEAVDTTGYIGTKQFESKKEYVRAELDCIATPSPNGRRGTPAGASLLIEKCVKNEGIVRKELFPRGTILLVTNVAGEGAYHVNGRPVSSDERKILKLLLPVGGATRPTNEWWDASKPRRIGESWPVEPTAILGHAVGGEGIGMTPTNAIATATLKQKIGSNLVVVVEARAKLVLNPVPPESRLFDGSLVYKATFEMPEDSSLPIRKLGVEGEFKMRDKRFVRAGLPDADLRITLKRRATFVSAPIP